jgi:o-succinylbenzoate---CoA ligase
MTITLPHEWAEIHADSKPDAPAVVSGGVTLPYGELDRLANSYAQRLVAEGIGVGDLVPIDATSSPQTVVALVGIHRSGAVAVPQGPGGIEWRAPAPPDSYAVVPTSGSFGAPRGVVLTGSNIAASADASRRRLGNDASDRWLLPLPLYHVGGLSIVWRSLTAGGSITMLRPFDAAEVSRALRDDATTMASLVPTMLHRILAHDPGPYRGLKAILLGGAPASVELVTRALDAGLPVLQTYGMTEAASQVATVEPGTAAEALGTVGPPLDGFSVSISERGEVLVDGPAVSPGYLGEPPRIGPLRTGDLGRIDGHGRLVVSGRRDGMIVTGGENVQPASVEAAIDAVPGVGASVVLGVPDDEWGEMVVAVVETAPAALSGIESAVRGRVARHEAPKRWIAVDALPLLPNGKPDRSAARRLADDVE